MPQPPPAGPRPSAHVAEASSVLSARRRHSPRRRSSGPPGGVARSAVVGRASTSYGGGEPSPRSPGRALSRRRRRPRLRDVDRPRDAVIARISPPSSPSRQASPAPRVREAADDHRRGGSGARRPLGAGSAPGQWSPSRTSCAVPSIASSCAVALGRRARPPGPAPAAGRGRRPLRTRMPHSADADPSKRPPQPRQDARDAPHASAGSAGAARRCR